jgi:putative ABC transport system permease protein
MASLAFDKEKGDTVTIVDPITLDEYNITVTDIVKNDSQAAIYCSRENAAEILGFDTGLTGGELPYNVIMSEKALDIEEDKLMKTISKQSLADQINEVKIGMENVTGAIDVFAIIICVAVVYMMVNVLITESTPSVSMLKVLGYRNKEINSMVLNVYHLLVPIALVLSLLLGFFSVKAVFTINVSEYKTYLETLIYPLSILKMSALIIASYVLSLFLLRGKAGKVDLVESLKDNRE